MKKINKLIFIFILIIFFFVIPLILTNLPERIFSQEISIRILRNQLAVENTEVRLIANHDELLGNCEALGQTGTSDKEGVVKLNREKKRTFMVLVQRDTLCIREGNVWRAIWTSAYGPVPKVLNIECDISRSPRVNPRGVIFDICEINKSIFF